MIAWIVCLEFFSLLWRWGRSILAQGDSIRILISFVRFDFFSGDRSSSGIHIAKGHPFLARRFACRLSSSHSSQWRCEGWRCGAVNSTLGRQFVCNFCSIHWKRMRLGWRKFTNGAENHGRRDAKSRMTRLDWNPEKRNVPMLLYRNRWRTAVSSFTFRWVGTHT